MGLGARVRTEGGHLLWASRDVAVKYAEARYTLYGTRQHVAGELYQGRWLWRVTKAKARTVAEPCS